MRGLGEAIKIGAGAKEQLVAGDGERGVGVVVGDFIDSEDFGLGPILEDDAGAVASQDVDAILSRDGGSVNAVQGF